MSRVPTVVLKIGAVAGGRSAGLLYLHYLGFEGRELLRVIKVAESLGIDLTTRKGLLLLEDLARGIEDG